MTDEKINVSRYVISTADLAFETEFITPAFLGGADGNAEIRTAPFKNLLRRWWRIAEGNLSPSELWEKEGELFGTVNGKDGKARAGTVRLRVDSDTQVYITDECLEFPKMGMQRADVYLGYGPVRNKEIKRYINPKTGSRLGFVLSVPNESRDRFIEILSLIHYFGTIGSRSRNGWGSLAVRPKGFVLLSLPEIRAEGGQWKEAFRNGKEYPCVIPVDEKGLLCWQTKETYGTYGECMTETGRIYKEIRMGLRAGGPLNKADYDMRFITGYPVTKHDVPAWDKAGYRYPSQLILKVRKNENSSGYNGIILHLPSKMPELMKKLYDRDFDEIEIWNRVHTALDAEPSLMRFGGEK